jgi:hypothetical protein
VAGWWCIIVSFVKGIEYDSGHHANSKTEISDEAVERLEGVMDEVLQATHAANGEEPSRKRPRLEDVRGCSLA